MALVSMSRRSSQGMRARAARSDASVSTTLVTRGVPPESRPPAVRRSWADSVESPLMSERSASCLRGPDWGCGGFTL